MDLFASTRRWHVAVCTTAALLLHVEAAAQDTLTLQEATRRALEHNPTLAVREAETRASAGRQAQAEARPNPELRLTVENFAGSGAVRAFDAAETTLLLSQVIELGGKREARTAVARAGVERATGELAAERTRVGRDVLAAYVHVAGDQHGVEVARATVTLAQENLATAQRRAQAGAASKVEEHRARIHEVRARIALEHAEHELLTSKRRLAALWGATEPDFATVDAPIFQRVELPPYARLAERIERNPEVLRLRREQGLRGAETEALRARAVPDLTVGAGARRFERTDDVGVVVELHVPLPFFDRGRGAIAASSVQQERAGLEADAVRVRLSTELFAAYQELIHAATELEALEGEILPEAEKMLEALREGFERGRFSQLEVLEAARTLSDVRRERIEVAVAYHRLVADIEILIDGPLAERAAP